MNKKTIIYAILSAFSAQSFSASLVNPSNTPLATSGPEGAKPNLMFILDDSGSMEFDYLGDEVSYNTNMCKSSTGSFTRNCRASATSAKTTTGFDAPFMAYEFNKQFFNPNATSYDPPVDYQGNSLGNRNLTNALNDAFVNSSSVINLQTNFNEVHWCKVSAPSASQFADVNTCKRNGINTPNPFNYVTQAYPDATFKYPVLKATSPHYFSIVPTEFCDATGVNCSTSQNASTPIPASVRWCATKAYATDSASIVSGTFVAGNGSTGPKCQFNYDETSAVPHIYPRFGNFQRNEVTPEQATNFANWYSYYRTRMSSMKTAASLAFNKITDNKRVGFITINAATNSNKYLPVADFNSAQKQKFYTTLFSQVGSNSTPLREALSRVGRYYSGYVDNFMTTGSGAYKDPIQYSCQKNFALLSTDGYWNGSNGYDMNGTNLGTVNNPDGADAGWSKRSDGAYDGGLAKGAVSGGSLADVAMYYYGTPLRGSRTKNSDGQYVNDNNVPTSKEDGNSSLHMNTYAISLGLNGQLNYTKDYYNGSNADFEGIKKGSLNWPKPVADSPTAIDDLWHAAVNGRGRYFSAQNSRDIVSGLDEALSGMSAQTSAAAAAATSSPMMSQGEDSIFASTYRTVAWYGDLSSFSFNSTTGQINQTPNWSANTLLQKMPNTKRVVKFIDKNSKSLKDFTPDVVKTTAYSQYFDKKGSMLSQYLDGSLNTTQKDKTDDAAYLINYLRGVQSYEKEKNPNDPLFRKRDFILGDFISSPATYVGKSRYKWPDAGYENFAIATASRQKMVYIGGNDGMLHAFKADTGEELWAVIPSQVMPDLYKLADYQYGVNHKYFVDGQITAMDAFVKGQWRTILISGMGAGGKGYFALDVTDPYNPSLLFEMCKDPNLCSVSDADLGYTYGNPIITKRGFDNKWVAYMTNGYDSDNGKGVVYEIGLDDLSKRNLTMPGATSTNDQIGLSYINGLYKSFDMENKADKFYLGGLNGVVYKIDTSTSNLNIIQVGKATDLSGVAQPITTKIELGSYNGQLILMFGTGQYLSPSDNRTTQTQTIYGIKDTSAGYGIIRNDPNIVKQTAINNGSKVNGTSKTVDWLTNSGWMLDLTGMPGERINVSPKLAVGTLNVLSNIPATTTCTAGGTSFYYQIDFTNGGSLPERELAQKLDGGLAVGQVVVRLDGTDRMKNIVTTSDGKTKDVDMYASANDKGSKERTVVKVGWREVPNLGRPTK